MEITRSDIKTSIPVEILALSESNFNQKYNNNFVTHAKLRIFYVGMTDDKRNFTEDFSNKVLKTLPLSPVVAYYNDEAQDFRAHNETQYVYGFVPENTEIEFKLEDGKMWAYTDVLLFTGRDDNIGDVANKIIGSKHSLELDPDTVEYIINRDEEGNFLNVEFTNAQFVGLSVVGESETPAFTGSTFFTEEKKEEFMQAFARFTSVLDTTTGEDDSNVENGGVENMNQFIELFGEDFLPRVLEFMKETYEERMMSVYEALSAENKDEYIIPMQMDDNTVVYYSYFEGKHYRTEYTISEEDGEKSVSFSEEVEVKPRYLTTEEIDGTFTTTEDEVTVTDDIVTVTDDTVTVTDDTTTATGSEGEISTNDGEGNFTEGANSETLGGDAQHEEDTNETNKAAFSESERRELEDFRKEKKEKIIKDFAEFISEKDIKDITAKISEYTFDELEKELSLMAMKSVMKSKQENNESQQSEVRVFKILDKSAQTETGDLISSLVDEYKDKN